MKLAKYFFIFIIVCTKVATAHAEQYGRLDSTTPIDSTTLTDSTTPKALPNVTKPDESRLLNNVEKAFEIYVQLENSTDQSFFDNLNSGDQESELDQMILNFSPEELNLFVVKAIERYANQPKIRSAITSNINRIDLLLEGHFEHQKQIENLASVTIEDGSTAYALLLAIRLMPKIGKMAYSAFIKRDIPLKVLKKGSFLNLSKLHPIRYLANKGYSEVPMIALSISLAHIYRWQERQNDPYIHPNQLLLITQAQLACQMEIKAKTKIEEYQKFRSESHSLAPNALQASIHKKNELLDMAQEIESLAMDAKILENLRLSDPFFLKFLSEVPKGDEFAGLNAPIPCDQVAVTEAGRLLRQAAAE